MNFAMSSTSLAHTYGNVTSCISEYVKSLFPKNFFRTVHISSTIAYKQIKSFKDANNIEYLKKIKPILVIKPRIELTEDTYNGGTYITTRILDNQLGDVDMSNLHQFIIDDRNKYRVNFLLNRIKINFDIVIILETQMEQLNTANYLRNTVRQERPFFIKTYLESHVPKEIFKGIAAVTNIPMYKNGSARDFLEYVNNNTLYPVTYKIKNSSGNDEFFRFYSTNIDTILTGMSVDDGTKRGFVSDYHTITFSIGTEFYTSGLYYLFTHNKIDMSSFNMTAQNNTSEIFPMVTNHEFFKDRLDNGFKLSTSNIFKVESNTVPDILDIKLVMHDSIIEYVRYHLEKGIPLDTFLEIRIYKDNRLLSEKSRHYSIDYNTLKLTTNVLNVYSTYRILIYVNSLYINNMAKEILGLDVEY